MGQGREAMGQGATQDQEGRAPSLKSHGGQPWVGVEKL